VLDAGYNGHVEVEIFNQLVWDTDPDETVARVVAAWAAILCD